MNDVFVRLVQFEPDTKGLVVPFGDGDYRIYINSMYNAEQQCEIYNHEIRHILNNDHYVIGDIGEIELAANDKLALLEEIKRVEECGLPLHYAIGKPEPPKRPELPHFDDVRPVTMHMSNGDVYELPEGITFEFVMQSFEAYLERKADDEDRRRDLLMVSGDSWG